MFLLHNFRFGSGRKLRFATHLLPFLFSLLCYRITDHGVNLSGGVRLHSRHDMTIKVQRDPDSRMAEPFAGNLRMDTSGKQLRGVCVSEIMETNARKIETPLSNPAMHR
ncbi:hypothetical protein FHW02_003764 [Ochrobactrum sp. RH1CCR137]|nr:hypothetical protein [Ochrobactrum sp. RH1CCR137]MBA8857404.1 hypothetical protein [Ochrobactrum sp. RH1CCR134]